MTAKKNIVPKSFNMWLITTMFAFVQFFFQIVYSAMSNQVMSDFNIGTALTGVLSSTFFYTFVVLQIPAGIILDRYDIKYVTTFSTAICGLGCIIFGLSPNFLVAVFGRLLMGVGSTFGFLGMIKVVRLWYTKNRFSLMVGLSELLANLAAAFGIGVATFFITKFGWRSSMVIFGLIPIFLAFISYFYLSAPSNKKKMRTYQLTTKKQIFMVIRKPQCWLVSIYIFGTGSIVNAFCALWGLSYLSLAYGLSNEMAGIGISLVFIGLAIGCPIIGAIINQIGQVRKIMIIFSFISTLIMAFIIFPFGYYNQKIIYLLLFLLGFFGSCYFLAYEKMKHLVHESLQGIAMAICNMSLVIGALVLQPLIGLIIQLNKNSTKILQYQYGLIILILVLLISVVCALYTGTKKELKKHRQSY